MGVTGFAALTHRARLWRRAVLAPARFAAVSALLLLFVGLALLGRLGTDWVRSLCLAVGGFTLAGAALRGLWLRRRRRDPEALVGEIIAPVDAELARRTMRAARLAKSFEGRQGASAALARLHFERKVDEASEEKVRRAAAAAARRYQWLGGTLAMGFLAANLLGSREIAEGLDLIATSGEVAPLPMRWIDRLSIVAHPPAYLRIPDHRILTGGRSHLPVGTQLTLRARAMLAGRTLVVSDGTQDAPFVSDGEGGLVAHYVLREDTRLVVAARFGDRLIVEPRVTELIAAVDLAPRVQLEGAPRTQPLSGLTTLPLRWQVLDDNGLRQVDLVLRSGAREERRLLVHLDGETPRHTGGHVLRGDDPFLQSLYLPAEIRIEARDNDPMVEDKWGSSEPIVLVPMAVGEPLALRYTALADARDVFVGALAFASQAAAGTEGDPERRKQRLLVERRLRRSAREVEKMLEKSYAGIGVGPGLQAFVLGQLRLATEARGSLDKQVRALEDLVLALDSALRALSETDARQVARALSEVAEEARISAELAAAPEGVIDGEERIEKSVYALDAGARQLQLLGYLGNDLGSVALADLGRIQSARGRRDWFHVALAAQHLAERLRHAEPSFGSSGGGGGGVEAGGGGRSGSSPGSQEHPSNAAQEFDRLAREIRQLAREHASAVDEVDRAANGELVEPGGEQALREEAQRRAAQLLDAVEDLPLPGHPPGSAQAIASLAREHSRAMAHALQGLQLEDAVFSGSRAQSAYDEALGKTNPDSYLYRQLEEARREHEEHLLWAKEHLARLKRVAQEQAKQQLQDSAQLERELAETANSLAKRGREADSPLPQDALDRLGRAGELMKQAAERLTRGQLEPGLDLQRQAQRLLEQADSGSTEEASGGPEGDGEIDGHDSDVPKEERKRAAEEFRRRVLENLGDGADGRLSPAVKRYAEGLLN